jgi:N-acetylmuramic acid 6-phosphate etherase
MPVPAVKSPGGAGRRADADVQLACDRLVLLMAGGRDALLNRPRAPRTRSGTQPRAAAWRQANDVLIAVAASGTTPFTLSCLREAKGRGALAIGIANNRRTPILEEADHPIWLDTGTEPIAGSTRMNAGTAQRIVLTVLSSLVMILLGRVYEGRMVEVQAVSKKLVRRSESILRRLTGRSRDDVREALSKADGNLKLAVLLLHGCDLQEATGILQRSDGQLRPALALIAKPGPEPSDLKQPPQVVSPAISGDRTTDNIVRVGANYRWGG